jgi:hypothetical protein
VGHDQAIGQHGTIHIWTCDQCGSTKTETLSAGEVAANIRWLEVQTLGQGRKTFCSDACLGVWRRQT